MRSAAELDERSLALHRLVVQKISSDQSLFGKVGETLGRYRLEGDLVRARCLAEWQPIVDLGIDAVLVAALDPSERGNQLRSASPFAGILTEAERLSFLEAWSAERCASRSAETALNMR
ncbi:MULTISPECIES: hypothetical protein [unclassified Variovorax]|uniref:hypothetical protein n=1 Tax=unclassified Variovorax TaxID=663243 RepID=UPI003F46303D